MSTKRFLFFYSNNRDHEIRDYQRGNVPSHRLFGLADLKKAGCQTLSCSKPKVLGKLLSLPILWCFYQALYAVTHSHSFDYIVAVHEFSALPALLLKRLGILRKPIIILSVALLHPSNLTHKKRWIWAWLLPVSEAIIFYASVQKEWVEAEYGLDETRLFFFPLGVDTDYFQPDETEAVGDFCLSVGTNDGKDFATLVKALPKEIKLVVVTDAPNIEVIKANARPDAQIEMRQGVPIAELKRLYQMARLHVIPLREMQYSSGQTVLLENMALGKTMIVSDTSGIRDYVENNVTALCPPPGDVEQLRELIQKVWEHPEHYKHLGEQAAQRTRQQFSSRVFAQNIVGLVQTLEKSKLKHKKSV